MRFHRRLILLVASAVAVAIVVASILVYVIVRAELRGNVDSELRAQSSGVFTVSVQRPERGKAGRKVPPPGASAVFGVSPGPAPKATAPASKTTGATGVNSTGVLPHS